MTKFNHKNPILIDIPMPIETERMIIREPTLNDLDMIQSAKEANWSNLQRWMVWTSDDQQSREAMAYYLSDIVPNDREKGGMHLYGFDKITGDFIMAGGMLPTKTPYVFATGYWGNIKYLGQGFATEMTRACIDFAFQSMNATQVDIAYFEGNDASRRVIEKCGFKFIETLKQEHQCHLDGTMMDEHIFALTRSQWERRCTP